MSMLKLLMGGGDEDKKQAISWLRIGGVIVLGLVCLWLLSFLFTPLKWLLGLGVFAAAAWGMWKLSAPWRHRDAAEDPAEPEALPQPDTTAEDLTERLRREESARLKARADEQVSREEQRQARERAAAEELAALKAQRNNDR